MPRAKSKTSFALSYSPYLLRTTQTSQQPMREAWQQWETATKSTLAVGVAERWRMTTRRSSVRVVVSSGTTGKPVLFPPSPPSLPPPSFVSLNQRHYHTSFIISYILISSDASTPGSVQEWVSWHTICSQRRTLQSGSVTSASPPSTYLPSEWSPQNHDPPTPYMIWV